MAARPDFQRVQEEFCAHLRDPRQNPRPKDVEERRMAVYRDLFFKNIQGFVERSFPMTTKLLGPDALRELSYAFFSQHGCRTPYFHKIGQEFVDYLSREHVSEPDAPPFLAELAHYEWIDVKVRFSDETTPHDPERIDPDGDLLDYPVVLSPSLGALRLRVPGTPHQPGLPAAAETRESQPSCSFSAIPPERPNSWNSIRWPPG